jgi:hypothetical protein
MDTCDCHDLENCKICQENEDERIFSEEFSNKIIALTKEYRGAIPKKTIIFELIHEAIIQMNSIPDSFIETTEVLSELININFDKLWEELDDLESY